MTATPNNLKNWFEQPGLDLDNKAHLEGTVIFNEVEFQAAEIQNALSNQVVTSYDSAGAIAIAGKAVVVGGTGLAMTLAAPTPYCLCDINLLSITSGTVVVTCASGVTFDGTNNTATFDAAADRLVIGYKSATEWEIHLNNSVVLSSV